MGIFSKQRDQRILNQTLFLDTKENRTIKMLASASLLGGLLKIISCWMTCSHTSYAITLVHTTELVPRPGGKIHMILDTIGHGLAFALLSSWVAGAYFTWHAAKYFWRPVQVPPKLAYIIDVLEMIVWQMICYSFKDLNMLLCAALVYCSFWSYRLFYKGNSVHGLRNAKGGDY